MEMDDLWARLADFEKRIDYATVERDGALAHSASTESGGIGIVLGKDSHGNCFVLDLIPGSSASTCGAILRGDRIEAIDGTNVRSKPLQEVRAMVAGRAGTSVTISLWKSNTETQHIVLHRLRPPESADAGNAIQHPDAAPRTLGGDNYTLYSSATRKNSPHQPSYSSNAPFSNGRRTPTAHEVHPRAARPPNHPVALDASPYDGSMDGGYLQDELARCRAENWQLKEEVSQVKYALARCEREKELLHEHLHVALNGLTRRIDTPEPPDSRSSGRAVAGHVRQDQAGSSPYSNNSSIVACIQCGFATPEPLMCGRCHNAIYCSRECQAKHWTAVHKRQCGVPG